VKVRLKSFGLMPTFSENMPSGIVPKPPKPGFVSFGAIDVGAVWNFLGWGGGRLLQQVIPESLRFGCLREL